MRMRARLRAPPRLPSRMMRRRCKDDNGLRDEIYEGGNDIVLAIYYGIDLIMIKGISGLVDPGESIRCWLFQKIVNTPAPYKKRL